MFYSYKNAKLTLNGSPLYAQNIQFGLDTSLSPLLLINDKNVSDYVPFNGTAGTLQVSYFITGVDPIKEYMSNEDSLISVNFAGLYFNSGYLRSYGFNAIPHAPVLVNAEIVFFDELKGEFYANGDDVASIEPLHFSSVSLSQSGIGNAEGILGVSYSFSSDIQPSYVTENNQELNNVWPREISFGSKQIVSDIDFDNLSGHMPMYGFDGRLTLNINNSSGQIAESFTILGKIHRRDIQAGTNQTIKGRISIVQSDIIGYPEILGFSPASGLAGSSVTISGLNLSNTTQILFFDKPSSSFSNISSSRLTATVPAKSISGPMRITTYGGVAISHTGFVIIDSGISF